MTENVPSFVSILFIATVLSALFIFLWVIQNSINEKIRKITVTVGLGLLFWLGIQAALSVSGVYYLDRVSMPPKLVLFGILPLVFLIAVIFNTKKGQSFIDSLSIEKLTYLHLVRIPVELVLFWLFIAEVIPKSMTFEGRNFDILAGLTAPFIIYFGYKRKKLQRNALLIWNIAALMLLINVVIIGLFSAPFPLQQWAFDQPNIALLHFPFSWLPTFVVPLVIFTHLITIRRLIYTDQINSK